MVDILIILFLAFGALEGFKQGFTKALINFIGVGLLLILSFVLKNPVSEILMSVLPFFPFGGLIKGVTVLNIALYEVMSFCLVFSILGILLKTLSMTSSVFEKILNFTIILGIPSKILGMIVGIIKNYIITFFVLYLLSMPLFSEVPGLNESKLKGPILIETPILSAIAEKSLATLDEFENLKNKYKNTEDPNEFNLETLDLFLKYKITTPKNVRKLKESGKISINGIDEILNKYEEE